MPDIATITALKQTIPFDEAISKTGYGLYNTLILLTASASLTCVIYETMCMMFIAPAAECDLNLNLSEKGLLSSVALIGIIVSSYLWGYMADTKGRKKVLVLSLGFAFITDIFSSIVSSIWLLITLRFLNGFFIGGVSSVFVYVSEFHSKKHSARAISWISSLSSFAGVWYPGLAWLILPNTWQLDVDLVILHIHFTPWRLLFICNSVSCLISALAVYALPESPKFLLLQGRKKETFIILKKMYVVNTKNPQETFDIKDIILEDLGHTSTENKGMWKQTVPLFKRPLVGKTLIIFYIQFAIFVSFQGILMWYPEILIKTLNYVADNPGKDVTLCPAASYVTNFTSSDTNVSGCLEKIIPTPIFSITLLAGVVSVLVYFLIGCVINHVGKKMLLVGILTISTLHGVAAQVVSGFILIQLLIVIFLMGGAISAIANAMTVELFPTEVKGIALGLTAMFVRVGAIAGTNIVGYVVYYFCDYLFYLVLAHHTILILVVLLLPSSTRQLKVETQNNTEPM